MECLIRKYSSYGDWKNNMLNLPMLYLTNAMFVNLIIKIYQCKEKTYENHAQKPKSEGMGYLVLHKYFQCMPIV